MIQPHAPKLYDHRNGQTETPGIQDGDFVLTATDLYEQRAGRLWRIGDGGNFFDMAEWQRARQYPGEKPDYLHLDETDYY